MSSTQVRETAIETPGAPGVDMKLEVVVIPVSDVDRAKRFYGGLGWRLDADFAAGDEFRVIQFTPPGSGCSVIFGRNVTAAAPGSAQGLYLIVSDIEAARGELRQRGIEVSEVFHGASGAYTGPDKPYLFGRLRVAGPDPEHLLVGGAKGRGDGGSNLVHVDAPAQCRAAEEPLLRGSALRRVEEEVLPRAARALERVRRATVGVEAEDRAVQPPRRDDRHVDERGGLL